MKTLKKESWKTIISGANLLGTGGGGTIKQALKILKKMQKPVNIADFADLKDEDIVCTVFGIGGKENCDPIVASRNAFNYFQKIINKKVSAIIPVEVGPMAIANAAFIAGELKMPLFDGDIVGLRSSPEVFLETITITSLDRTPCVIANDKGKFSILEKKISIEKMEEFFRNFAISSGGDAFVAGYPLKIKSLKKVIPQGSISVSKNTGLLLKKLKSKQINLIEFCKNTDWTLFGIGKIIDVQKNNSKGFCKGKYKIADKNGFFEVLFKNENLVLLRNNEVVLTCPDSISLLDLLSFKGINNFEENKNKEVAILGKKAIPIWRTIKGKKLFSPKNLGFNFSQKLLK